MNQRLIVSSVMWVVLFVASATVVTADDTESDTSHTAFIQDPVLRERVEARIKTRVSTRSRMEESEKTNIDRALALRLMGYSGGYHDSLERGADPNRVVIMPDGTVRPLWTLADPMDKALNLNIGGAPISLKGELRELLNYGANPNLRSSLSGVRKILNDLIPKGHLWRFILNLDQSDQCSSTLFKSHEDLHPALEEVLKKDPLLYGELMRMMDGGIESLIQAYPVLSETLLFLPDDLRYGIIEKSHSSLLKYYATLILTMHAPYEVTPENIELIERGKELMHFHYLQEFKTFGAQFDKVMDEDCKEIPFNEWLSGEMQKSSDRLSTLEWEIFKQGLSDDCVAKPLATWNVLTSPMGSGLTAPVDKLFRNVSEITAIWYAQVLPQTNEILDLKAARDEEVDRYQKLSDLKKFYEQEVLDNR